MDYLENQFPEMTDETSFPEEGGVAEDSQGSAAESEAEEGAADGQESSEPGQDAETEEKPKRRRKKKNEASAQDADLSLEAMFRAEDGFDGAQELFDDGEAEPDTEPSIYEGEDEPVNNRPNRGGLVVDAQGRLVQDRRGAAQHDLAVLAAARRSRQILFTTLSGIEMDADNMPRAIFYVGAVKVMIPFDQLGFDIAEFPDPVGARLMTNRLMGAKIWYMVRGVDIENRIAVASRRDAMQMRRRTILDARNNRGGFRINAGMKVTAQVLHVADRFVELEIYGMVTEVRVSEISNLWITDVRDKIRVGDELAVELTALERNEQGRAVSISASIRLAEEAVAVESERGQTLIGEINGFSNTAYYVRAEGMPLDVRCPIKNCHTMELMEPGDLVRFYITGVFDGISSGAITKVLKKKHQTNIY